MNDTSSLSLRERKLRFVLMKTLADMINDEVAEERAALTPDVLKDYTDNDTKGSPVKIPGSEKVANITVPENKPKVNVDQDLFIEWCRNNRQDLLMEVSHPPVEAWVETVLTPEAVKVIQAEYKLAGTIYVTPDMEPVDGVEYVPAPAPTSFRVTYADRGQERLVEAYRSGELSSVVPGRTLPQLGA